MLTQLSSNATSPACLLGVIFTKIFLCSFFPVFDFVTCFFFPRARKERTFLSALIKKFHGVLMSIPPSGKHTHTHKMLLFPSGCYSIALICFVWCFILVGISGPDEDEWSWTHPLRLPKPYFMCTLSWVGSLSKCEVIMLQLDCLKVNTGILQL